MLKNFTAVLMAVVLMLAMSVSALAVEKEIPVFVNENVRVINHSNNISAQAINEIVNDVSVSMVYDDGTVVPVESVITIDNLTPLNKSRSGNSGKTYRVTLLRGDGYYEIYSSTILQAIIF